MTETALIKPSTRHKQLLAKHPAPIRHAAAPFPLTFKFRVDKYRAKGGGIYPRAGVRVQPDGKWLLQIWYSADVVRVDPKPLTHDTRRVAFIAGQPRCTRPGRRSTLRGSPGSTSAAWPRR